MNTNPHTHPLAVAVSLLLATVALTPGQTTTIQQTTTPGTVQTTTLNSMGTVTEIQPSMLVIKSETGPLTYRYSKTTTYVDETGAPVSVELVKSGLPVTVHYVREGTDLVASRVVVRRTTAVAPAPAVVEKKTTTTTTTSKEKED